MIYMGSKVRIAKDILKIMQPDIDKTGCFVDMFCGGGNLLQFVNAKQIIANDISPYTISFLSRIYKEGVEWLPKDKSQFSKGNYLYVKNHKELYRNSMLGYIGYNLSFGGKWFGGWCSNKNGRDYIRTGYSNTLKQYENLKDKNIKFYNLSYDEAPFTDSCVIYCDIPYKGATKYLNKFDHDKFYNWCRKIKQENDILGNNVIIYVSEYDMPEDFKCVWQKEIKMTLAVKSNGKTAVEKLFKLI